MTKINLFSLTTEERKQEHYNLWMWVSENLDKEKEDWPGWGKYRKEQAVENSFCFACVEADARGGYCCECPINHHSELIPQGCMNIDSDYIRFECRRSSIPLRDSVIATAKQLAITIANSWEK